MFAFKVRRCRSNLIFSRKRPPHNCILLYECIIFIADRYFNDTALRVSTLMWDLGNKMQLCIQGYNKRPYGVGLLVAGYDDLGPHIYQVTLILFRWSWSMFLSSRIWRDANKYLT